MKNLFVDVNVIIDFLIDRVPFSIEAADLFELALGNKVNLFVSAVCFNNIYYITRQVIGHKAAIANLEKLYSITVVLDVTSIIIKSALESDSTDFEDAIQYYTALSNPQIEGIVTRDRKGFRKSKISIFTPKEVIGFLSSAN